jgi:hypothetical protein
MKRSPEEKKKTPKKDKIIRVKPKNDGISLITFNEAAQAIFNPPTPPVIPQKPPTLTKQTTLEAYVLKKNENNESVANSISQNSNLTQSIL